MSDKWIRHDGKHTPKGPVRVRFRDGVCLTCALHPQEWFARWEWWGARSKKDHDVIAYLPAQGRQP